MTWVTGLYRVLGDLLQFSAMNNDYCRFGEYTGLSDTIFKIEVYELTGLLGSPYATGVCVFAIVLN